MPKLRTTDIAALLAVAGGTATNLQKGRALERVVGLTFGAIRGVQVRATNTISVFESEELDAALYVEDCKGIPLRPMVVLVECKNWSRPVGSQDVDWFLSKLRKRRADGILLAANGITGDATDLKGAHDIIQGGLTEDVRILVFTQDELRRMATTDDVLAGLRQKQVDLVTRRTSIPD